MHRKLPIFYSALMLTGVNLLLRLVSTSFQVYISSRIGAAGVGLLQLVMSVGMLAMTAGIAGIRTATMYLTAEEFGRKRPKNITWVLSGCFLYSITCSAAVAFLLYTFAPVIAQYWIGDQRTVSAIQLFAGFLPVSCLCGVMTGYFTAANRIGTLAAVEVAEQFLSMTITMMALTFYAGSDPAKACQCVILGSGISACMVLGVLVFLRIREGSGSASPIPIRQRLMATAVPLALADDLKSGISTTENLMVPKRLALYPSSGNPLASFGTVCGMVFPILMFPAAILYGLAELLIPELARCSAANSWTRIRYLAKRSLRVALIYGCFFCGLMYLLSEKLCIALYNSAEAGSYLKQYAILIPVLYCDAITDAMTKGLGQQKACVRYNIITSSMDVVLLFLLLPRYGMSGYFFSFLVTHLLNFYLSLRRLLKITGKMISPAVPFFAILSTFLCIYISSFVSLSIIQIPGFILLMICLMFLCGVLEKEDIHWIKGLITKKAVRQ